MWKISVKKGFKSTHERFSKLKSVKINFLNNRNLDIPGTASSYHKDSPASVIPCVQPETSQQPTGHAAEGENEEKEN